jgi:hypothetical protein
MPKNLIGRELEHEFTWLAEILSSKNLIEWDPERKFIWLAEFWTSKNLIGQIFLNVLYTIL